MSLIVSGGWFGKKGLYEFEILNTHFPSSLEELRDKKGFVLISYDFTERILGVSLKKSPLPPVVFFEIGNGKPVTRNLSKQVNLKPICSSLSVEEFKDKIIKIKSFIEKGDVYQINLTCAFKFLLEGNPEDLFLNFYKNQPVPYAFFLKTEDFFVISGSMELFLKKRGKRIRSEPIKGTGKSSREIISSEKERAENLMITDMMRNDLGKIAVSGTVKVRELFKVRKFKTLYQMHSTVEAETHADIVDILKATFPPASVTGAPKFRAIEIIEELEPHPRGYYCGVGGFISEKGNFTLSVLIRTAFGSGPYLTYYTGCGIVWDSDPEREVEELFLKMKAFYKG